MWCKVISVGPGRLSDDGKTFTECTVRSGQHVLVGKYVGTEIKIDGKNHLIVREEEILCVEEDES
jgi:chaperonin GroES